MGSYLLDSDTLIGYLRGRKAALNLLAELHEGGGLLGVCSINIAEVYSGVAEAERPAVARFLDALHYFETTAEAAKLAGQYRYEFARRGISLPVADTLVAAVAAENHAVVVTGNIKDYPMTEVRTIDLLAGQD
ncbi:MAG: PIN domain-containing protein [Chloroflexi bacterium]|nr:PIN domain-containing protein [Chloroflexota bacterium]